MPSAQTFDANYRISFLGGGRLDFNAVLSQLEREYEKQLGIKVPLLPRALGDPDFMGPLKDGIIVNSILVNQDILAMFTPLEGSLHSSDMACGITLRMKGSGRLVQIPIRRDAKGAYDVTAVIAALEQSYREVMFLDSGEVILSGAQRRVMRAKAPEWLDGLLAEQGVSMPQVIVDTENAVWEGNGLKMKMTVSAQEDKGGAAKEYVLNVPFIEGGKGDYSGIAPLAKKITTEWLKENACLCSEAVCKAVYKPLQKVVPAYMSWVIAETRKDVQRFRDAFNAELQKKLELVEKFAKEADKYESQERDQKGSGALCPASSRGFSGPSPVSGGGCLRQRRRSARV